MDNKHEQVTDVTKRDRTAMHRQKPFVIWLTGLSGSGKSTLAHAIERALVSRHHRAYLLDGDLVRQGLNKDLGYDQGSRQENMRRVAEVSKLMVDAGLIVITALISPYRADRDRVKALFRRGEFIEVHLSADMETCERRDPKGLYARARKGEIKDFTGIDSPYEAPLNPDIRVDSGLQSVEEELDTVIRYLVAHDYLSEGLESRS
jgi:adenylyl-sulfate kinase